jgi:hypothetical protein
MHRGWCQGDFAGKNRASEVKSKANITPEAFLFLLLLFHIVTICPGCT